MIVFSYFPLYFFSFSSWDAIFEATSILQQGLPHWCCCGVEGRGGGRDGGDNRVKHPDLAAGGTVPREWRSEGDFSFNHSPPTQLHGLVFLSAGEVLYDVW